MKPTFCLIFVLLNVLERFSKLCSFIPRVGYPKSPTLSDLGKRFPYVILVITLALETAYPQPPTALQFSHYSYKDGLLINPIDVMLQDHQGYMWFGSEYGLSRFDGYEFITYTHKPNDTNTLSHSHVYDIAEDGMGNLWVATENGLNKINPARNMFQAVSLPVHSVSSLETITSLYLDEKDQLWIGGVGFLVCLNLQTKKILQYPFDIAQYGNANKVSEICGDQQGHIWFVRPNSLYKLDVLSKNIARFYHPPPSSGISEKGTSDLQSSTIFDIFNTRDGWLWLGTWAGGLTRLDPQTNRFFTYPFHFQSTDFIHKTINDIAVDNDGILWLATDNGLCRFHPQRNTLIDDLPNPSKPNGLSSKRIRSVYRERSGAMWVATDVDLHRYAPPQYPFRFLVHEPLNSNSLGANPVYSMCEGLDGIIWFGTNYGGLNSYDPKTKTIKHYMHDPSDSSSISDNTVTALCTDPSGKIWIGTWTAGICLFDPKTETFQRFPYTRDKNGDPEGHKVVGSTVRAIEAASNGDVWFGTSDYTISIFNPETETFRYLVDDLPNPYTPDFKSIYSLCNDHNGTMWIGTGNYGDASPGMGLYNYDPQTNRFRFFNIRKNESGLWGAEIPDILEDRKGNLWLATEFGITHLDTSNGRFRDYFPTDGFWGKVTASVLESDDGTIWVSSKEFGLSAFNPETGDVRNFGKNDGLMNLEYLSGSALKARDGTLYFGGMGGVTIVPNGQIHPNPYIPPVVIQQCMVLDESVSRSSTQTSSTLDLPYWKNSIQFDYAALGFSSSEKNQYQYRLLGLTPKWIDAGSRRSVSYSYLPPGDYAFQVKGSNNDGVWNENPAEIRFQIAYPFWETMWFQAMLAGSFLLVAAAFFYWRIKAIAARNVYLEKQVHARTLSLQNERDHSHNILQKNPSIIFGFAQDGKLTFINPAGEQYLYVKADDVMHMEWWELFPKSMDRSKLLDIHRQVIQQEIMDQETNILLPHGDMRSVIWSFVRHVDEQKGTVEIIAFGNDVTEKMEHEILEASTREQRNIGREIHDSICQSLTGIYCLNEAISRTHSDKSSETFQLIERMKKHLQDVTVQSRNIARSLYLHDLEHEGLNKALWELTKKFENLYQVTCRYICDGDLPSFDFNTATHLYRIAQEAINNAVKYSGADEICLHILRQNGAFVMSIEDRGKGFAVKPNCQAGMGLNIMKYRARMIQAELSIESVIGAGTTVRCVM